MIWMKREPTNNSKTTAKMIFNKDDRIKPHLFRPPLLKPLEHDSGTHPYMARAFKMQERRHFSQPPMKIIAWSYD